MRRKTGYFVISLDFELEYGVESWICDHKKNYKENIKGARKAVLKILDSFNKYDIHATWAVVGMLLGENRQELLSYLPEQFPGYENSELSTYNYIERIGQNEEKDPAHFALGLIRKIKDTGGQEIATHTFSHYYCEEKGQNRQEFEGDLHAACRIMSDKLRLSPSTIIFPSNEVNRRYLSVLEKYKISIYRGKIWLYKSNRLMMKILRSADTYTGIFGNHIYGIEHIKEGNFFNIKASAFLKPVNKSIPLLQYLKVKRIKKAMLKAAKKGKIYHLWWHPHNFGVHTFENIRMLEDILLYYTYLNSRYGYQSANMKEISEAAES